jgi:hypothetical protein
MSDPLSLFPIRGLGPIQNIRQSSSRRKFLAATPRRSYTDDDLLFNLFLDIAAILAPRLDMELADDDSKERAVKFANRFRDKLDGELATLPTLNEQLIYSQTLSDEYKAGKKTFLQFKIWMK